MTIQKPNKHELKTKETRELLLQAAEKIFVRDGYEGAELGEIAALAGRTKGAIYAQFKSKEDIFLALVEEHAMDNKAHMEKALAVSTSIEQNRKALRQFYLKLSEDQAWTLLMLEFKLFAIRHPEAKKRLQSLVAKLIASSHEKRLVEILGPVGKGKETISRSLAIQLMQSLLCGLTLEARFEPDLLREETLKNVVGRLFDALI